MVDDEIHTGTIIDVSRPQLHSHCMTVQKRFLPYSELLKKAISPQVSGLHVLERDGSFYIYYMWLSLDSLLSYDVSSTTQSTDCCI